MMGQLRYAQIIAKHQITLGTQLVDHQVIRKDQHMVIVSDGLQLQRLSVNRIKRIFNVGFARGSFDNVRRIS